MAYPRFNRSRQFKQITRSAGDITVNTVANTWEELAAEAGGPGTGGFDLTLTEVQAGDVIETGFSALTQSAAVVMGFDVRTMNGTTPINSVTSQAAASGTAPSLSPWYCEASRNIIVGPSVFYTIGSTDIISGAVTFRPYVYTATAVARIVYAGTSYRFQFWVRNNGPAQA